MTRDQKRFNALRDLGCIACRIAGLSYSPPDVHHIVDKGYRKHSGGHQATIPLCPWHHRGEPPMGLGVRYTREIRGPSMALEAKEFSRIYGTQRELLAKVNALLSA